MPIARSPSMKSTGMTGCPVFVARTTTPAVERDSAGNLPAVFQNFLPVCRNCFIAENYRPPHAERLVDRGWERGVGGKYVPKKPA